MDSDQKNERSDHRNIMDLKLIIVVLKKLQLLPECGDAQLEPQHLGDAAR
jgi:hypothetical protein